MHAEYAVCDDCRKRHRLVEGSPRHRLNQISDWREKHLGHRIGVRRDTGRHRFPLFEAFAEFMRGRWIEPSLAYGHNADVKEASQAEQSMTVTNLHSLATSATAGWTSNSVDNSTNLYLDAEIMVHLAAVNTAPANNKLAYIFAYGSTDGSIFTSTGTSGGTVGTEGSLTFPDITANAVVMPLLGVIPYPVQNKAIDAGPFYMSDAFRRLPLYWGLAIINYTGMTFAASGNTIKYRGNYNTVA